MIHSPTSTVPTLKFGYGYIISLHILLGMLLFIHAGINVNPNFLCLSDFLSFSRIFVHMFWDIDLKLGISN